MAQYLKQDSELGYIEDQAEIECLKFNHLRHVVLGCMLGDFDETGAYVVDPEIVRELIEMPKFIVETMDNIEICKSALRLDKQITFAVTFEGNKATLSLLEKLSYEANFKLNSGTYSNINEYVIDSVETSGEINRNAIYARWNIDPIDGNIIDIFNCDDSVLEKYFGIVNRFKYLLQANKLLIEKEEEIEEIESGYSNEIYEILKRYPKLEEAVMKQITETLNEKKGAVSIKKLYFAKTFNEILDNAIQSHLNVLDEKEKQEFEKEKRNAVVNLNVKRAEVLDVEAIDVNNDQTADLSPKVLRFKTDVAQNSKSVSDLGEEFVASHKVIEDNKKESSVAEDAKTEKEKLVSHLIKAGLGNSINGEGAKKPNNLVAEAAEKVAAEKQSPEKAKTAGGTKSAKAPAKKPAAKKAGGKGKGGKKSGGKGKSGSKDKSKDSKKEKEEKEKEENKKKTMLANAARRRRAAASAAILAAASTASASTTTSANVTVDIGLMSLMTVARQAAKSTVNKTEKVAAASGGLVSTNQVKNNQGQSLDTQKSQHAPGEAVEATVSTD